MRRTSLAPAVIVLSALVALPALAQQPTIPSTGKPGLDEYRASRIAIYTDDFGELKRYREADAALKPPAPGETRVIFLGDSITDYWKLADYFPGKPYINRGIDGQTTPQMLVRFRQDVIDLHPKILVVLAGTNDVAGVTGRTSNEDIEANYASIARRRCSSRTGGLVNCSTCRQEERTEVLAEVSALISSARRFAARKACAQPVEIACWKAGQSLTTTMCESRKAIRLLE